jgi:hypothetical protein
MEDCRSTLEQFHLSQDPSYRMTTLLGCVERAATISSSIWERSVLRHVPQPTLPRVLPGERATQRPPSTSRGSRRGRGRGRRPTVDGSEMDQQIGQQQQDFGHQQQQDHGDIDLGSIVFTQQDHDEFERMFNSTQDTTFQTDDAFQTGDAFQSSDDDESTPPASPTQRRKITRPGWPGSSSHVFDRRVPRPHRD